MLFIVNTMTYKDQSKMKFSLPFDPVNVVYLMSRIIFLFLQNIIDVMANMF